MSLLSAEPSRKPDILDCSRDETPLPPQTPFSRREKPVCGILSPVLLAVTSRKMSLSEGQAKTSFSGSAALRMDVLRLSTGRRLVVLSIIYLHVWVNSNHDNSSFG